MLTRKDKRIESKKKKIQAFLDVIKLNDKDRTFSKPHKSPSMAAESVAKQDGGTVSEPLQKGNLDDSGKPKLSDEELSTLRAELRARQKATMKKPKMYITHSEYVEEEGKEAHVLQPQQTPLFVLDLQHLLLNAALNQFAPWKPRWCKLLRPSTLKRCVLIIVDDVSVEDFLAHHSVMPCLANKFKMRVEMMSPSQYGRTITQELFDVPVSFRKINRGKYSSALLNKDTMKKDVLRLPVVLNERNDCFSRVDLLLNMQQMIEEDYPLPLMGPKYSDFIFSKTSYSEVTDVSPLFAIDCEMCITSIGKPELTRVSLINEKLGVLYDELVTPPNPITDYLTRYSGITKEMLEGVTTSLHDVQRALADLLPTNAIICGQSLNGDLNALKMFHPYVIDTSIIYNLTGQRHVKSGLKRLAHEFLCRDIQTGSKGHSPVEDAIATMELVLLKLQNGPEFGDAIRGGVIFPRGTPSIPPTSDPRIDSLEDSQPCINSTAASQQDEKSSTWEPHRNACSLKRKSPSDSNSSDEESADNEQQSKRIKIDSSLIPLDQRKKRFFIQPGSREYECFFEQCQFHKKSGVIVGREEMVAGFQARCVNNVSVSCDKQAVKAACQLQEKHFFTVVQLRKFSQRFTELMAPQQMQAILQKIDLRVEKILRSLEEKCLVSVLFTGRTTPVSTHHAMTSMMLT